LTVISTVVVTLIPGSNLFFAICVGVILDTIESKFVKNDEQDNSEENKGGNE